MPGGTTERYRPETQGRRGNGNGASPAWAPARASRLLTGAGRGVRPCRDRLAERDSRMRQVASTLAAGSSVILPRAGTGPPGVRFRPLPESTCVAALTFRSWAIGRGNGAEGHENRRFESRRARNRGRIGGA